MKDGRCLCRDCLLLAPEADQLCIRCTHAGCLPYGHPEARGDFRCRRFGMQSHPNDRDFQAAYIRRWLDKGGAQ